MNKRLLSLSVMLLIEIIASEGVLTSSESNNNENNHNISSDTPRTSLLDNGLSRALKHIYAHCIESEDFFWCSKVQTTKLLGRALKVQNINIIDGLMIMKKADWNDTNGRTGRASGVDKLNLSNRDLENLSMKSLDALLFERFHHFVNSRQIQINLPRMLAFGQRNSHELIGDIMDYFMSLFTSDNPNDATEGRGKKKDKKYLGLFIAAVMLKTAILKMAYHSIAIIAGKALIVGKIALIISAIIGLKKLVGQEGGEKTTYEIVKHPQVQQSHTYSSSHSGEYEGGHESGGGSYHRSIDDEMMMQDKAYHAWTPTTKIS